MQSRYRLQSCSRGGRGIVEDMCYEPRPKCVFIKCCCLLLQYLIQSFARGGRRIVEDMCYEIRRAEACVD